MANNTYGNIPLRFGETPDQGWARYQTQLDEDNAREANLSAMRQQMGAGAPAPTNPYLTGQTHYPTGPVPNVNHQAIGDRPELGQNPWLQQQGQALQAMSNQNLQQNVLPGIGQGAQAAGMYGSSRQGVAEGQAMGNAQTGLNAALANMYSQSYGQDQDYNLGMGNLALGNKQANNNYDLGLRNSDLGFGQLDADINQQNFNNQMQSANFGMGVYDRLNGMTQQGINAGTQIQNTPLNYQQYFTNSANGVGSGYSTGTTSQTNQGNPWLGALGGAQIGNAFQYPK